MKGYKSIAESPEPIASNVEEGTDYQFMTTDWYSPGDTKNRLVIYIPFTNLLH